MDGDRVIAVGDGACADRELDVLEPVRVGDRRQPVAGVAVVRTRRRADRAGAFVGDLSRGRVRVCVAAGRQRECNRERDRQDAARRLPHEAVMSIEVMRSPTWIESMTSMPEVTDPKWL